MAARLIETFSGSKRIVMADVLRGISVLGILLLHSVEHFNYYRFPDTASCGALAFSDKAVWDSLFFTFSGKAYAIFSLLFGFTFFLQDERCRREGRDFRLRFVWRMVLLFIFGNLNAAFFPGEVLVLFSIVGLSLPLVARLSDKWVLAIAVVLLLQPDFIIGIVRSLAGVEPAAGGGYEPWWRANMDTLEAGGFWSSIKSNLTDGQMFSIMWARDFGRMVQSPALMMIGMLIGRRGLLEGSAKNMRFWIRVAFAGLLCFFPLHGLADLAPQYVGNETVARGLGQLLGAWHKLAFMVFMVGAIYALFYHSRLRRALTKIAIPFGRMSLTMYIAQSLLGSFFFFPWGLDLGSKLGSTASLGVAAGMFVILYIFAVLWLHRHSQGPLEWIWRRATWIGYEKKRSKR
jgi:uncharacterized protein